MGLSALVLQDTRVTLWHNALEVGGDKMRFTKEYLKQMFVND